MKTETQIMSDLFISQNKIFSIIMGLIVLIAFFSLLSSFILLFWFGWWWKLTISSAGIIWCVKKIIEQRCQNWLDKLSNK